MGNYINIDSPAPESTWDYVKIYRATTEEGTYTEIGSQLIANLTYYDENGSSTSWYKIKYYNSSTELGSFSDPIQARTEYYTSMRTIKNYLQLTNDFTDSTKPSLNTVMDWIFDAEDEVDGEIKHSWRETSVSNEYHDTNGEWSQYQMAINLNNRKIRTFDTDEGDKLEIWNGSDWEDYVTNKTEGRDEDFWVDYENGIIYIRGGYFYFRKKGARITYRYGEASIPRDIKTATTLIVVKDFYLNEDRSNMLPSGEGQNLSYASKIEIIDKKINNILNRHREFKGRVD